MSYTGGKLGVDDPNLFTEVDKLFAAYDKPAMPGCALAIIHKGEIIYKRGYGLANLEYDIPITPATIFDIGSASKQFTAACALLLEYQGKLSLTDNIQKYLPELKYTHPVTILDLIHHSSGIPDYIELMTLAGMTLYNDYPKARCLELIAKQPLTFTPGKKQRYSNSGYFLLAEIVARVSGQSLNEFATENIFKPLGMNSTQFYDDQKRIVKNRAMAYTPNGATFDLKHYKLTVVGNGGIHTTVEDLFSWDQNFYDNKLAGGQGFTNKFLTPGYPNSGKEVGYAFGLRISSYRGKKRVSHGGRWAGYCSEFSRLPEQHFSVIILANRYDYDYTKASSIMDLLLVNVLEPDDVQIEKLPEAKPQTATVELSADESNDYFGQYFSKQLDITYTFIAAGEKLVLDFPYAAEGFVLEPKEKDKFSCDDLGLELTFLRSKRGEVRGLGVLTERANKLRFKKLTRRNHVK